MPSANSSGYAVASCDDIIYVLVKGLANMANAPMLDAFLHAELERGAKTACIDLSECRGMDSTFMGTLVGYHGDFSDRGGRMVIINPSEENSKLLQMLGVATIVPVVEGHQIPALSFVELDSGPAQTPRQRAEMMLAAHQHLIKLSEDNRAKFAPFIAALEKDLGSSAG